MFNASSFAELAQNIGTADPEPKISCSYRLPESVVVSINSLAQVTGVNKSEVVSSILELGCTQMVDAIEETRPDLADKDASKEAGEPVFNLCTPENARQIRNKFGKSAQLDTSDEAY
jgi:hypothetical protein